MRTAARKSSEELIYDWNSESDATASSARTELLDETLRDGLQSPSIRHPHVDEKIELLSRMEAVGIEVVKIGMPSSSSRVFDDAVTLARFAVTKGFALKVACAARALPEDVERVAEVSQRAGAPVEAYVFVPSSAVRLSAEGWDDAVARRLGGTAVARARELALRVAFVAEDATRASPEALRNLIRVAIDEGASRVCICDTAGFATPKGTSAVLSFVRSIVSESGASVGIDWHGHDDRGLALANALAAVDAGADRIHATALGVGERAGNVAMELFVMNALLSGAPGPWHAEALAPYCRAASRALDRPIPRSYPFLGDDAFRTTTGTHAAAIIKAEERGDAWLADRVYSSVPASRLGRKQEIAVGSMSGKANVLHWMRRHGISETDDVARAILSRAKRADRALTDQELWNVVREHHAARRSGAAPDEDEQSPPRSPAQ